MRFSGINTVESSAATFCIAAAMVLCAGCGKPNPADRTKLPSQDLAFEPLFTKFCAGCHGADGTKGAAPPLNDPLFLAIASDDELHQIVANGRSGTMMAPFLKENGGDLTAEQIGVVIKGIRTKWGEKEPPDKANLPPYVAAADSHGNIDAGKAVFTAVCAGCHGENGTGGEKAGAVNNAVFLSLVSDQLLRRVIITGRPDLGMPNFQELGKNSSYTKPLTDQQISDVAALLASWRAPSAETEPTVAANADNP